MVARRPTPGIRSPSVRTGGGGGRSTAGSAIQSRAKTGGIRSPHTQHRGQAMEAARRATGHVGRAQQAIRSGIGRGAKLAKVGTAAEAFRQRKRNVAQASTPQIKGGLTASQRTPAQKTGLTAAGRASLKQTPAQKQQRMASAQGRMGTLVSNFAKRQRGGTAAGAVSALSRPLNRKPTRGGSRGSSRSGGR